MSEKPTVYVVTDGEYSSYDIIGVCSTREKAEEMKKLYAAENRIEEYSLDFLPEHPPGMLAYTVWMRYNGDITQVEQSGPDVMDKIELRNATYEEVGGVWVSLLKPYPSAVFPVEVVLSMWARDKDHAIKIAGDTRVRLMAEERWKQPE